MLKIVETEVSEFDGDAEADMVSMKIHVKDCETGQRIIVPILQTEKIEDLGYDPHDLAEYLASVAVGAVRFVEFTHVQDFVALNIDLLEKGLALKVCNLGTCHEIYQDKR